MTQSAKLNHCSSLGIVNGNCNGRRSCTIHANNGVFGDPCGGTYKYLEVSWTCVKGR